MLNFTVLFFFISIYLLFIWLCWVLVVVHKLP